MFYQRQNLGRRFDFSKMHLSPPTPVGFGCGPFIGDCSVVVVVVVVVVCGDFVIDPCFVKQSLSSILVV